MLSIYLASIVPAVCIIVFFFFRDRFKEPPKVVFITFVLGFLFVFPLGSLNLIFDEFGYNNIASDIGLEIYRNLFRAGFHEELYKYLILIFYCSRHTKFNEPMDAIVYGLAVSLGFSARENIGYVMNYQEYGISFEYMAAIRLIPTVMHAVTSMIMALFLSKAIFSNQSVQKRLILAFLIPVLFHGIYNILITYNFILGVILLIMGIIYVLTLYRRVRKFQEIKLMEPEIKYNVQGVLVLRSILVTFVSVAVIILISINIFSWLKMHLFQ